MKPPPLGSVAKETLVAARLAAHYAAQPLAAAAYAVLPMRDDHSHTNFRWKPDLGVLAGRPLDGGELRGFLDPARLRIGLLGREGELAGQDLTGLGLEEAFRWMEVALAEQGMAVPTSLELPAYDLPESSLAQGAPFPPGTDGGAELSAWFELGHQVLRGVAEELLGTSEVVLWPHHFDMAALCVLDEDTDAQQARSVNAGLSPGDGSYAEPYFYVTPWPKPASEALPRLASGKWHTAGFTAAVLEAPELRAQPNLRDAAMGFVRTSAQACLDIVTRC